MADPLTETADRLYALPPQRFVAERDAAVAAAREAGDTALAGELRGLKRPTVAAWLVNLLALRRPELLGELLELAEAMRAAQQDRDGAQLRELTARRRAAVAGLVATARGLAQAAEPGLAAGKLPLAELETTLTAALGDRDVAAQLRSGRLVRAVAPAGFGELPRARLRLVTGEGGGAGPGGEPDLAQAAAELERRTADLAARTADLERRTAERRAVQEALAEVDARLAELAARRSELNQRLIAAEAAMAEARGAVVAARRRVGDAEAAREALDAGS